MHPFWSEAGGEDGTGGFVAASELEIGEPLRLHDGSPASVTSITNTGTIEPVYNFSVDGWHTYHVGELGVWVHNVCPDELFERLAPSGMSRTDFNRALRIWQALSKKLT